jgi:hypothetical protein
MFCSCNNILDRFRLTANRCGLIQDRKNTWCTDDTQTGDLHSSWHLYHLEVNTNIKTTEDLAVLKLVAQQMKTICGDLDTYTQHDNKWITVIQPVKVWTTRQK